MGCLISEVSGAPMSELPKIGIIGGAGWLGGALAKGLVAAHATTPDRLRLSYRRSAPAFLQDAHWTRDNQDLADGADVVIVSVRPSDWPAVEVRIKGKLVISVMAGVAVDDLMRRLGADRVVRSLPNAAAEVNRSYTPWFASAAVTASDRQVVTSLFEAIGACDEVHTEAEIDYLTGLTGTGPAYPALLADAMIRDAVLRGVEPELAQRAVSMLLIGAGRLLEKFPRSPADIVREFVEYDGVTAAAIKAMLASSFADAVRNGLSAALTRSESQRTSA